MTETPADHLPPSPSARPTKGTKAADTSAAAFAGPPVRTVSVWGDRILFASLGLLLGFAAAYVYLEKTQGPAAGRDPHAGLTGVGPGATRDLPESGGGSAPIADAAVQQRLRETEEAVAKDPKNYDLLVKLGNAYYDAEDPRRAVDAYERALKIKGTDVNVLTDLGVSYRNLGDVDKALALFEKAAKIDPTHWQSVFNQAIVYGIDKGDAAKAKAILEKLKKDHPGIPSIDRLEEAIAEKAKGGTTGS